MNLISSINWLISKTSGWILNFPWFSLAKSIISSIRQLNVVVEISIVFKCLGKASQIRLSLLIRLGSSIWRSLIISHKDAKFIFIKVDQLANALVGVLNSWHMLESLSSRFLFLISLSFSIFQILYQKSSKFNNNVKKRMLYFYFEYH